MPKFAYSLLRPCLVLLVAACLAACGPNRIYEQDYPLADDTWRQDSILVFKVDVADVGKAYDLFYHVRYDLDYPYYNLYVRMQVQDSAGQEQLADRHELVLLDPQTGKPLGSGWGGVFDKDFTALQRIRFAKPGRYQVRVGQYMRMATLPGLHNFGIRLSEHTPEEPAADQR